MSQGQLFTSADYLGPLHAQGCAHPAAGWTPLGTTLAYVKTHSWGEFVFDFAWANAYAQHGLSYYPKLVICSPFTPVPGPRLMGQQANELVALAEQQHCSSAHALFCLPDEADVLEQGGWLRREDLRFVWRNQGYESFDAFLAQLCQKKRKNIKRERRRVAEASVEISWRSAADITPAEWPMIYQLYSSTYVMRGQTPYLTLACLQAWAKNLAEQFQFCLAHHDGELIAMAFFFVQDDALYGRHWGAADNYHSLHFELCYYQGLEYAINNGLRQFDAGVQGEHKVARGFDPEISTSMHWIAHQGFRGAIENWLQQERKAVQAQLTYIKERSAFKRMELTSSALDL